jgi:hypothetical protein
MTALAAILDNRLDVLMERGRGRGPIHGNKRYQSTARKQRKRSGHGHLFYDHNPSYGNSVEGSIPSATTFGHQRQNLHLSMRYQRCMPNEQRAPLSQFDSCARWGQSLATDFKSIEDFSSIRSILLIGA